MTSTVKRNNKKGGPTDYSRWDRVDYTALGVDEEEPRKRPECEDDTPQGQMKAYLAQQAEAEMAKKRLRELEEEHAKAELRLAMLKQEHSNMDNILLALGVVFVLLVLYTAFWVQH